MESKKQQLVEDILATYGVLNSDPEEEFDTISQVASVLFGAPIALITVLSERKQFLKSRIGLERKEIPIDISFCRIAMDASEEILLVEDARKDARFKDNPLVTGEPNIVFYAGVPIFTPEGYPMGALCVIDQKPRRPESEKLSALKVLGTQVTRILELRKSHQKLSIVKVNLETETRRLNNILEATQVGTWEWDMVADKVIINARYAEMAGYSLEELSPFTMDTWYALIHPEDRSISDKILEECFAKKRDYYSVECRLVHKKGHFIWINDRGKVTKWSADGKPLMMSGTHTDISERKKREIQFQSISDNIPGVVYRYRRHVDGRDALEMVSNGASRLWGISAEMAMKDNQLIWDRYHPEDIEKHLETIRRSEDNLSFWIHEWRYLHPDGRLRWHKGTGNPTKLKDGSVVWDAVILDITQRKEAEFRLEKTLDSLRERVKEQECLYRITQLRHPKGDLDSLLKQAVAIVPSGLKYPESAIASLSYGNIHHFSSPCDGFSTNLTATYETVQGKNLTLNVGYPYSFQGKKSYPILQEEVRMLDTLVAHLGSTIDQIVGEAALSASKDRINTLIQTINGIFWEADAQTNTVLFLSPQVTSILGYTVSEWLQVPEFWESLLHPEDSEGVLSETSEKIEAGKDYTVEYRLRAKDGRWIWIQDMVQVEREGDRVVSLRGLMVDITERKTVEEALEQSEKRFKALVQGGSDLTAILSNDGRYVYVSPNYPDYLGYAEGELLGNEPADYFHPDDKERVFTDFVDLSAKKRIKSNPYRYKRKDGSWCWLQSVATDLLDDEAVRGIVVNSVEITDLIEVQERLERSEARYRGFYESQTNYVIRTDLDGNLTYANPKFIEDYGWLYPEESPLENSYRSFVLGQDREKVGQSMAGCMALPEEVQKVEIENPKKGGGTLHTLWELICLPDAKGQPGEMQWIGVDISYRISMENALKKSNERFELIMQTGSESIWDYNPATGELFLGDGFRKNFGFEVGSLSQNNAMINRQIHPDDLEAYLSEIHKILREGSDMPWDFRYRLKKSDGNYAYVHDKAIVLRGVDGKPYRAVGAMRDITMEHYYGSMETIDIGIMETSMDAFSQPKPLIANYLKQVEDLFPGMKASLLWISGNRLYNFASPSLPDEYLERMEGLELATKSNSWNTLANLKKKVVVPDLMSDEKWVDYTPLFKKHGIRACASQPIVNSEGKLVASLLFYFGKRGNPGEWGYFAMDRCQRLISLLLTKYEFLEGLRKSNERYTYLNMATNDAIYDWDVQADKFLWGEGFYRIFGFEKGEEINQMADWAGFIHPIDAEENHADRKEFLGNPRQNRWHKEFRFLHRNGSFRTIEEIGYMIRDDSGKPQRMIGVLRDVSEIKKVSQQNELEHEVASFFKKEVSLQETLRGVLAYLTRYGGYAGAEIWLVGINGKRINLVQGFWKKDALARLAGKGGSLTYGTGLPGEIWKEKEARAFTDSEVDEKLQRRALRKKGKLTAALGIPLLQGEQLLGVLLFFSDRKKQELSADKSIFKPLGAFLGGEIKRKRQEEEMLLLFESAPEVLAIAAPDGHFAKVNPAFCHLLGYTAEELTSQPFSTFIHPEDLNPTENEFAETITGDRKARNFVNRYRTKSGEVRWISWNSSDAFGEEGLVFSYGHDITEMVELQALLDNATQLSRVGSWELNLIDEHLFLSKITREIYELPDDYFPGLEQALEFYREDFREFVKELLNETIQTGKSWDFQAPIVTYTGEERWIRSIGQAEFAEGKCLRLFGSFQDIHPQKSNEIQLAKNNRLLEVISEVIGKFLLVDDWQQVLEEVFELTGNAVGVDRVYLFRHQGFSKSGDTSSNQLTEWVRKDAFSQGEVSGFQVEAADDFAELLQPLQMGTLFSANTCDLPPGKLKDRMEARGIGASVLVPIRINREFYGVLGIDDCKGQRHWSEHELSFLQTISSNLASAIQRRNSQLALQESFEEKNTILESIGEAFFALDRELKIRYWNQRAENLLGVSRSKVVGKRLYEVFPEVNKPEFQAKYTEALEKHKPIHFEEYYRALAIWLEVNAYPSGEGFSVFIKDVTREKVAFQNVRLSNERFEKIAEATNDAIWDYDVDNDTLFWGKGFYTLFGYDLETTVPSMQLLVELMHPDDRERVANKIHQFKQSKSLTNWFEEYRFLRKDGFFAFVMDRAIFIRNQEGRVTRVVGAMTDITYRKEYEESLEVMNQQMALHARELERSNLELEQFAYVASHDLQEPLRMVSSFMGLLERKYGPELDEKAHQYIQFAVDGAKRMKQIILDLLEYSRIGKSEDKLKLIATKEIVDEVCLLQKRAIRESGAAIHYEALPSVISFRAPLLQVFQNLIGNALKYRSPGTSPKIEIYAEVAEEFWKFSVRDNGIGIDPMYHEKIFIIFNRLHNKAEYGGTGMGLAIVKKIIDNLGGEIGLESTPGKGSTFYFTLPRVSATIPSIPSQN